MPSEDLPYQSPKMWMASVFLPRVVRYQEQSAIVRELDAPASSGRFLRCHFQWDHFLFPAMSLSTVAAETMLRSSAISIKSVLNEGSQHFPKKFTVPWAAIRVSTPKFLIRAGSHCVLGNPEQGSL